MIVRDAQRDLRRAFVGGGPGVFISALVWFTAAAVKHRDGTGPAFAVLFLGGMLIFPIGTMACRFLFKADKEAPGNPLSVIALEGTVAMIGGLFGAWLFLPFQPAYVFPLAAIAVGTHYAVFRTIYGDAFFWTLGGLITAVGILGIFDAIPIPGGPILSVGVIELIFAVLLTMRAKRADRLIG